MGGETGGDGFFREKSAKLVMADCAEPVVADRNVLVLADSGRLDELPRACWRPAIPCGLAVDCLAAVIYGTRGTVL